MALNSSGPISLAGSTAGQSIAVELGESATGTRALNDTIVRDLAEVSSGAITMPTNFWGKSSILKGKLYSWGYNILGTLGLGDTVSRSSPSQVGALSTWQSPIGAAAANGYNTLAITEGKLYAWGNNGNGQLGLGDRTSRSSPTQVGALTTWAKVSTNANGAALAIKEDGTLWSWGENFSGGLGLGDTTDRSSPVQIGARTDWAEASSSGYHASYGITESGQLYAWGNNGTGQLGLGNTTNYSSPVQVGTLTNWSSVVATFYSVLALKTDGTMWSWGGNNLGQMGIGNVGDRSSPVQIGSDTNWAQISAGDNNLAAVRTTGTTWTWGQGTYGKLGQGDTANRYYPTQVGTLTNWSISGAAGGNTYWVKTNGQLWTVGRNYNGSLGIGASADISSPVQIGSQTNWLDVKGAAQSGRALKG